MRTTIDIAPELMRRAKRKAADEGVPLRQVIEAALRAYLSPNSGRSGFKLQWRTERGTLAPGVDLDDRDSLLDFLDGKR